ncbi:unnamed protein product [Phytophthora lilii]|uniref:Unnamed protein product n=1 Tax=Phytophthora lilii TaxID=2077276 RepID=A0A9W6TID6_9STRA|nr:unnamed protein product [Phytophthora lilii]
MNIRQRFASDGSVTFYNAVAEYRINQWRSMARPVTNWGVELIENLFKDEGHLQAPVPDEAARAMSRDLMRYYRTFIPESEANEWRWIKTLAGMGGLPVRREFAPPGPADDMIGVGSIPGCILVALDNGTSLYVYGWNRNVALRTDPG